MSPSLPQHDLADVGLCDADRKADSGLRFSVCPSSPDFQNIRFGQLRPAITRPAGAIGITATRSPFRVSVGVVVGCSSKPEVIRADARRIVAMMKNPKAIRDWAIHQCVGETMSRDVPPFNLEGAIAVAEAAFARRPFPTVRGFTDFRPEPFFNFHSSIVARKVAI